MSRPRLPSLTGLAKRSFWLFFGGIWLLVGVVMLVVGTGMAFEERSWNSEAIRTTGIVLTKDIVPADSDSSTQYRVRFRFPTDDGTTAEGDQAVSVEIWEGLTERGPVTVHYRPSSPTSARLDPGSGLLGPAIFLVFGVVLGGVGGVLVLRAVRGLMRARRMLRSGVDAEGTVTGVEQTNVSFNRRPQFRVRYRYRDRDGKEHVGDSGYLDWELATSWNEGDRVSIRYDPRRPAESLWVGRIETPSHEAEKPPRIVDAPPS